GIDVTQIGKPGLTRLQAMIEFAIHPEDQASFEQSLMQSLASGKSFESKYRLRRSDGIFRWMSSRAAGMRDEAGQLSQWYGLCHDIDDQVRAQEALGRSERHLQRLIDAFPVHVWSWTSDGKLSYINIRFLEDLDCNVTTFEELVIASLSRVHAEDAAQVAKDVERGLENRRAFSVRYRRLQKEGPYRWTDSRFEPLAGEDGTIVEW